MLAQKTIFYHSTKELEPFVAMVLSKLTECGRTPGNVLLSWSAGLIQTEVDDFLDCLDQVYRATDHSNGFLGELRAKGAIPLAGVLAFVYRGFLQTHNLPSFVTGGSMEDPALHRFLCGNLRALLDGMIGRTTDDAEALLAERDATLEIAANVMATRFSGLPETLTLNRDLLMSALRVADKVGAALVFNTVRLPEKALEWGAAFVPYVYSSYSSQYDLDHLIAKSVIQRTQPSARVCEMLAWIFTTRNRLTYLAVSRYRKAKKSVGKLPQGDSYGCVL